MRVGSIGSSYVPKITAKRGQNAQTEKANLSFKADVRIDRFVFFSNTDFNRNYLPDDHGKNLAKLLDYADTAYKDVGSDNIVVFLRPFVNGEKKKNRVMSNIAVFSMFKDPEIARKEILESAKKNPPKPYELERIDKLEKYKNRDPIVMKDLRNINMCDNVVHWSSIFENWDSNMPDKNSLDRAISSAVNDLLTGGSCANRLIYWTPSKVSNENKWDDFLYGRANYPSADL